MFNKQKLREKLFSLEAMSIEDADRHYREFLTGAMINRSENVEFDDRAQAVTSAGIATQLEHQLHAHEEHRALLDEISFEPTDTVGPGALVKIDERYLVIAVPTEPFEFEGVTVLGISCGAPLCAAMENLKAGDTFEFGGMTRHVKEVY